MKAMMSKGFDFKKSVFISGDIEQKNHRSGEQGILKNYLVQPSSIEEIFKNRKRN